MSSDKSNQRRWTEEETLLALYLYFQLPFGKLHRGNPEIQKLATALDRTDSSVAMKLGNFASLDPKITDTGRRGLAGASRLDRETYAKFGQDWTALVAQAESLWDIRVNPEIPTNNLLKDSPSPYKFEPYTGESTAEAIVNQRLGQGFFRRAVLANYEETCCITGIADARLLSASHIVPWSEDAENRHNPANGLLLSATLDRAFDRGLITINSAHEIIVSRQLGESHSVETRAYFQQFENTRLRSAVRFNPDPALLNWHNNHCFVDR